MPPPFTWREPTLSKGVTHEQPSFRTAPRAAPAPQLPPKPAQKSPPRAQQTPSRSLWATFLQWFSSLRKGNVEASRGATTVVSASPAAPPGLDVNLMTRRENGGSVRAPSLFHIATTSAIVLGTTMTLLIGGWLMIRKTADERATRAEEIDRTVATLRGEHAQVQQSMAAMTNLGHRLRQAKQLLNGHPYTGTFIEFLERETYGKIQLTNIAIRPEENRVSVEVVALDIPAVVGQLLHWVSMRAIVASVGVTSIARQERPEFTSPMYSFDVTLDFVPAVFHRPLPSQ
ncbi:hypothetical protein HY624_01180 [Candidatus Uhrbacteria bacterium]|nr:hypothetical protein [Candidatus Uhrbacteria bacterium]